MKCGGEHFAYWLNCAQIKLPGTGKKHRPTSDSCCASERRAEGTLGIGVARAMPCGRIARHSACGLPFVLWNTTEGDCHLRSLADTVIVMNSDIPSGRLFALTGCCMPRRTRQTHKFRLATPEAGQAGSATGGLVGCGRRRFSQTRYLPSSAPVGTLTPFRSVMTLIRHPPPVLPTSNCR
jgi:hypothetical protein